jgi:hypothetical protein
MRRFMLMAALAALAMLVLTPAAFGQQDLDCEDFDSQADAQAELRADPSDPNGLDGNDDDGIACESLPAPRDEVPVQGAIGGGAMTQPTTTQQPVTPQYDGGPNNQLMESGGTATLPDTGGPAFLILLSAGLILAGGLGVSLIRRR